MQLFSPFQEMMLAVVLLQLDEAEPRLHRARIDTIINGTAQIFLIDEGCFLDDVSLELIYKIRERIAEIPCRVCFVPFLLPSSIKQRVTGIFQDCNLKTRNITSLTDRQNIDVRLTDRLEL